METKKLRRAALLGGAATLAASFALGAGVTSVSAQDAEAEEDLEEFEEVVVTGSRIKRVGIDTIRPTIGISSEVLEKRAFTNIADAINEIPAFGAGLDSSGAQNAFTVGQAFSDLFDLGTQRTLTLVNGRRFVSSNTPTIFGSAGGLQVDLNSIPVALLERFDVVPLAGAATYGSDAIAGVVNVILKDDYEGFEVSGQYGFTEEGGGSTYQIQSTWGSNFADDRGNVVFSIEYNKQEGLLRTDRPFFTDNNPDYLSFGGQDLDGDGENDDIDGDGFPDSFQRIVDGGQRVQLLTGGGAVSAPGSFFAPSAGIGALADGNFYQFNPDGTLDACTPGETPAGSIFFAYGGTCGVDFFDEVAQIRSPVDRILATSIGHYDITDNIRYSQEFMFSNSKATELVNQGGFQSFPFSGTSSFATLSVDNPFLTDQARQVLQDNGLTTFGLNRFNNDLVGNGEDTTENFTWRYAGGLNGDFEFAERAFYWDVNAVFGQADVETRDAGIIDGRFVNAVEAVRLNADSLAPITATLTNDLDGDGLIDENDALIQFINTGGSGLAVEDIALGSIVCQVNIDNAAGDLTGANSPATGGGLTDEDLPFVDGCVPLNLFGQGAASDEALAFINGGPGITSSNIGQRVLTANFGGEIIDLPAGPLAFAAGWESRRETAEFTPGLGTSIPITRSSPFDPTTGRSITSEFYLEGVVPLVSADMDIPLIENAEIEGSVRRVRNKIIDPQGVENTDVAYTYEIGARYSPIKGLAFRGTYASAIRSPSLVELFAPQVQAFISGDDPCDNREINNGPDPDLRRANCIAAGITDPDNFTSNIQNATIIGRTGGNPELGPERSKSFAIGMIWEPSYVQGLTLGVDYINIQIEDRIENFDFEALAETCFDSTDFPNDACNSFERDPATGQVIDVTETFLNAANSEFEGIQYRLTYNFDVASALALTSKQFDGRDYGQFDLDFNIFQRLKERLQVVPTRPADRSVGDFGDPNVSANFDFTWTRGPIRVFHRINYQDSPLLDATGDELFLDDDDNIIDTTRARFVHNSSASYEVREGTILQFSVDNLFDRRPDRFELAAGRFTTTELLGRRFTFRVRTRF